MNLSELFALYGENSTLVNCVLAVAGLLLMKFFFFTGAKALSRTGRLMVFSVPVLIGTALYHMDLGNVPATDTSITLLVSLCAVLLSEGATLWNLPLYYTSPEKTQHTSETAKSWHKHYRRVSLITLPFALLGPVMIANKEPLLNAISAGPRSMGFFSVIGFIVLMAGMFAYITNSFRRYPSDNTYDNVRYAEALSGES